MGTQRCPMATYRTNLAAQTTLRWPGPALAGDASGTQRDFMDLRHRGAVARTAQEISAVPDLPSPFPALGAGGQTRTHLARSSGGVAGSRKIATGGGFHRRLLHGGKKGASQSGPPNAAKGRKSSLSPMITVFLSPLVSKALRRTKANSRRRPRTQLPRHPPGTLDRRQSLRQ